MALGEQAVRAARPSALERLGVTIAQYLHLAGAATLTGSIFLILVGVIPSTLALDDANTKELFSELIWRVRGIFWGSLLTITLSGVYLTVVGSRITTLAALLKTPADRKDYPGPRHYRHSAAGDPAHRRP